MTAARADLTSLLGSRICHDLISPLGAIGNGVELLSMAGLSAAPEIALIAESVENANARIRFFRVAFGASSPGAQIPKGEIRAILDDLTKGSRLNIQWNVDGDPERAEVKLAFLLIQCLESAMPWGGEINITGSGADWRLVGTSERFKLDSELWDLLLGQSEADALNSASVHFALVPDVARRMGRSLTTSLGETRIDVSF
jgi:histidine phosphotransferase ChpT